MLKNKFFSQKIKQNQHVKIDNNWHSYSKKNAKSPQKQQINNQSKNSDVRPFMNNNLITSKKYTRDQYQIQNQNSNAQKFYQANKISIGQQQFLSTNHILRQHSYPQKQELFNSQKSELLLKKINTSVQNKIHYNFTNIESGRHNNHNISQMIDKEAESQINTSILQNSFVTGNKFKNKLSQMPLQQDSMQNFMKCMNEQIYIARQNFQKKFNEVLKTNAKLTKQLQDKINKNQILLKQKDIQIVNLKQLSKQSIKKTITETEQYKLRQPYKFQVKNEMKQAISNFDCRRIEDLQSKLKVFQNFSQKINDTVKIDRKIQILEKGLIRTFYSKFQKTKKHLQTFIRQYTQKINILSQNYDKATISFDKLRQQFSKNGFNQNQIKQISLKIKDLRSQMNQFMRKQFKYENFSVYELQNKMKSFKESLRDLQSNQFQNTKLLQNLNDEIAKLKKSQNLSNLIGGYEVYSKYTITNPNLSKISIDQLSNTNQYSHLLQKMSPKQQNINKSDSSIISMNFTDQISQSLTQTQLKSSSNKNQAKIEFSSVSKHVKATDMKQTNVLNQNSPISNKQYFLPNYKPIFSIHQTNDTSTQQKIKNLNDLKMESKEQIKTPIKKSGLNFNSNDKNNNSYWSIGQMEDFNVSKDFINQTNDFNDDQFFYLNEAEQAFGRQNDSPRILKVSPEKNSRTSQIQSNLQFSPMKKKKLVSTQQNFYQPSQNGKTIEKQNQNKLTFMYNSNFDYQNFSQQDQEKETKYQKPSNFNKHFNPQTKLNQKFSQNQLNFMEKCKDLKKFEFPVKIIFDRKKGQGVIKMMNFGHPLNGRTVILQKKQLQNLSQKGILQVKTYV